MGRAYIRDHFKVTRPQYEFVRENTPNCNSATYKFFCHLLVCTVLKHTTQEDIYIPVPSQLIEKKLKRASWKTLHDLGLIEPTGYSPLRGECREFLVKDWVIERFLQAAGDIYASVREPKVDLFTGKVTRRTTKNRRRDDNGRPEPVLILKAMDRIFENGGIFDRYSVEQHLRVLEAQALEVERSNGKDQGDAMSARARYNNDQIRFQIVMNDVEDDSTGAFLFYRIAHNASITGRIHAVGGFQSCSKEMKAAAFSRIKDVHNYDLVASQVNGLIQQFEIAGLDTSWLVEYRDTPSNKRVYAELTGMSEDCWKPCLIALIMGADIPPSVSQAYCRKFAILTNLYKEAAKDIDKTKVLLMNFINCVAPLHTELRRWHHWLLDTFIPYVKKQGRGGSFIMNKCGKRLYLSSLPKTRRKARAKVAAFILQGQESCFIHHLTLLDYKYGYRVIANEHDGVITIGEIPVEAVNEAAALSGLANAQLEEKPFVKSENTALETDGEAQVIEVRRLTKDSSLILDPLMSDGIQIGII